MREEVVGNAQKRENVGVICFFVEILAFLIKRATTKKRNLENVRFVQKFVAKKITKKDLPPENAKIFVF